MSDSTLVPLRKPASRAQAIESALVTYPAIRSKILDRARHHLAERTPGELADLIMADLNGKLCGRLTADDVTRSLGLEAIACRAALDIIEEAKRVRQETLEDYTRARAEKWYRRNVVPMRRAA